MFTKKPERETGGDPLQRVVERSSGNSSPSFAERLPSYARSASAKSVPSIIGEDLTITGNVISKGEIQVDGSIEGDVHCGSLLLGDKSEVIGQVVAEDVVVRGKVVGSIRGLRVTLQAQSRVEGDIYHQSLAIEQGAFFEGKSRRSENPLTDEPAGKPTAAATPLPASPLPASSLSASPVTATPPASPAAATRPFGAEPKEAPAGTPIQTKAAE